MACSSFDSLRFSFAMACSSFDSLRFSFLAFFLLRFAERFACLPPFLRTIFFTTFLRLACLSLALYFLRRRAILRRAALCCLLPFLYFDIFAFSFAMACSSFDSLRFSFLVFFLLRFAERFACLPPFFTIFFFTIFFTTFLRFACLSLALYLLRRAAILRMAALCCLLPFLYFDIFAFSFAIACSSFDSLRFSFLVFFLLRFAERFACLP